MKRHFKSGMLQSWNKFCFTGGVLEMAIELPGDAHSGGKSIELGGYKRLTAGIVPIEFLNYIQQQYIHINT